MPAANASMRAVPDEPNVALRPTRDGEGQEVVLSFPTTPTWSPPCARCRDGSFDWDLREWSAPADGWVAAKLAEILRFRPELSRTPEFDEWLADAEQYWVGHVRTARYDGRGWFALDTLAGTPPEALREGAIELEGRWLAPLTARGGGRSDGAARPAAQHRRPPLPGGARVRRAAAGGAADPHARRRR